MVRTIDTGTIVIIVSLVVFLVANLLCWWMVARRLRAAEHAVMEMIRAVAALAIPRET